MLTRPAILRAANARHQGHAESDVWVYLGTSALQNMLIDSMDNQEKFRDLCRRGDITQDEAARLIAEQTMRPCSVRTVRAWLADPGKPSARPCPDWGILALETRLKTLKRVA